MSKEYDEDLEYFRKQLWASVRRSKEHREHEPPKNPNPLSVDEDFYIASWKNLDVELITTVFLDAAPVAPDDSDGSRTHVFGTFGTKQFIMKGRGDDVAASDGRHSLSQEQYDRLVDAGAELFF